MSRFRGLARLACTASLVALSAAAGAHAQAARLLDGFETLDPWEAKASEGVSAKASRAPGVTGDALRLDFDFGAVSGYAFARRTLPLTFPDNYEISFWMRADAPVNTFEVKLVDASGENVWWRNRPDFVFPTEWTRVRIKKRQIGFAWGPTTDRTLRASDKLEFVVTRGAGGGKGSVYIDDLTIRELPPEGAAPPAPVAAGQGTTRGSSAARAVDGDTATVWRAAKDGASLTVDLGVSREFGGLELTWAEGAHASAYDVLLSDDGKTWTKARTVAGGDGGRDPLLLTESEARYLRLDLKDGPGRDYGLAEVEVKDLAWGADPNAFVEALAAQAPRGTWPRGFVEQAYWTLIGADGAADTALMSEDGALEIGKGGFSIEPFVRVDGRLRNWADVKVSQSLQDGYLPIPSATWTASDWTLKITGFVEGDRERSGLVARYDVTNTGSAPRTLDLVLAARPFQVNGPRQFLNTKGGVSRIDRLGFEEGVLAVNGRERVWPLQTPTRVAAGRFDSGLLPYATSDARSVTDETGLASGTMTWRLELAPGETKTIGWYAPLTGAPESPEGPAADLGARQARVAEAWRARLDRVDIRVPEAGRRVVDTLKTSLAHILMSRDGPALKPGTRSYDRSWIRDGAMIADGLIRLGSPEAAADYARWYAPELFETGKVPCCVDRRGADPTPENDSHGEFIFLAAEVWRATGDRQLLQTLWPKVDAATRYMDALRASETAANAAPGRRHLAGLMPPSISHEGYSSKPAYSYWDDFWTLLGYKEAVGLAEAAGDTAAAERIRASRDAFRHDLYASIAAMPAVHGVAFIPGAADLGDFDATSTTIALTPGDELDNLPRAQLEATFERYWREFVERRDGTRTWDAYTPYEIRNVGAFVRLGRRDRANALLDYFFSDRRPAAWNGWAEVVGREPRKPVFIGDMPHAWISSDYIRAALDLFAYRRERDRSVVLAAGVPPAWLDGQGIAVRGLRTPYGLLSYSLKRADARLILQVDGAVPPGGFVLPWPYDGAPGRAALDGKPLAWEASRELRVRRPGRVIVDLPRSTAASRSSAVPPRE
jgi:hypothetical protein